jgi:hypothetical protein
VARGVIVQLAKERRRIGVGVDLAHAIALGEDLAHAADARDIVGLRCTAQRGSRPRLASIR